MIIINTKQNSRRLSTNHQTYMYLKIAMNLYLLHTTATHNAIKNPLIMYS